MSSKLHVPSRTCPVCASRKRRLRDGILYSSNEGKDGTIGDDDVCIAAGPVVAVFEDRLL